MSEDYKEALVALHSALSELKALSKECEEKVQVINIILEKQGLTEWPAGEAVSKSYCAESHSGLVCDVIEKIKVIEKSVNSKIKWAWIVLVFVLGIYGTFIGLLINQ